MPQVSPKWFSRLTHWSPLWEILQWCTWKSFLFVRRWWTTVIVKGALSHALSLIHAWHHQLLLRCGSLPPHHYPSTIQASSVVRRFGGSSQPASPIEPESCSFAEIGVNFYSTWSWFSEVANVIDSRTGEDVKGWRAGEDVRGWRTEENMMVYRDSKIKKPKIYIWTILHSWNNLPLAAVTLDAKLFLFLLFWTQVSRAERIGK